MNGASNDAFAGRSDIKALGRAVIALRVDGGRVPPQCMGVAIEGELITSHAPASIVQPPKCGSLWWVHPGPYVLELSPVGASPEAGVRLTLEVMTVADKVSGHLACWLDDRHQPVLRVDDLVDELRGHPVLHVPPCVQRNERLQLAESISRALLPRMGLICRRLERVDLYPGINCAAAGGVVEDSRDCPEKLIESDGTDRFGRRLFAELPRLADCLRRMPLPADKAAFAQHRALLRQVEHLAHTTGRLPTLEAAFGQEPLSPDAKRRLQFEAQRAVHKLDEAWSLVGAEDFDAPYARRRFLRLLRGIDESIARRRTPGWGAA